MTSFLTLGHSGSGTIEKETLVEVKTVDQFCHDYNIEFIDVIKSNTQGFDLEVFHGAEETIRSEKVGIVYFRVIFSNVYEKLPSFAEIYEFLTSRGFLFGSTYNYCFKPEYYEGRLPTWMDVLFVHRSYIPASLAPLRV
jgi:hypothetical protein